MTSDVRECRIGSAISLLACHVSIHGVTACQRTGDLGYTDVGSPVPLELAEVTES